MVSLLAALLLLLGLGLGGASPPAPTPAPPSCISTGPLGTPCRVPTRASVLERVVITRSGGFAGGPPDRTEITDASVLADLARRLPARAPLGVPPRSTCADCFTYVVEIDGANGLRQRYAFDDSNVPPFLAPILRSAA